MTTDSLPHLLSAGGTIRFEINSRNDPFLRGWGEEN